MYDTILYYTKVALTRPSAQAGGPGGGNPKENCKISFLEVVNYIVLYCTILEHTTLHYTKVGPARPSARASGLAGGIPLENCKISILGVVDFTIYYIVL